MPVGTGVGFGVNILGEFVLIWEGRLVGADDGVDVEGELVGTSNGD